MQNRITVVTCESLWKHSIFSSIRNGNWIRVWSGEQRKIQKPDSVKSRFSSNFNCGKDFFNLPYFPDVYTQQLNLLSIGEICRFKHALVSMVISRLLAIFFFFSCSFVCECAFFFFFLSKTEYYMTIAKQQEERKMCRKESSRVQIVSRQPIVIHWISFFRVVGRALVKQRSLFSWHGKPYVFRLHLPRRFKQNTKGGRQVVFGLKYQAS